MSLYFKDKTYLDKALADAEMHPQSTHTREEAFRMLAQGTDAGLTDNVCALASEKLHLTSAECYALLQGVPTAGRTPHDAEETLLEAAYACIDAGKPLGTATIPGRHGHASDWISHCLIEGRLAGKLAAAIGLDPVPAEKLGILHDCGRKIIQNFEHTIRGFELLTDAGWDFEAVGCLTHSFLGGGRCTNCERAEPGFFVDDAGIPHWTPDAVKDDMTAFLEHYRWTDYDLILNFSDLMATSSAVVSPQERLRDILSRRDPDPANRWFFLAEYTNRLNEFRCRMLEIPDNAPVMRADAKTTETELNAAFEHAAEAFYQTYLAAVRKH